MVPTAPAIANAVFDAAGVRIDSMPLIARRFGSATELIHAEGRTILWHCGPGCPFRWQGAACYAPVL